jgi:hypothetical protein
MTRRLSGSRSLCSRPSGPSFKTVSRDTHGSTASIEMLEGRVFLSASQGEGGRHGLDVVYVASNNPNPGQNAILAYHRDEQTGALTALGDGSVFPTGGTGFFNGDERLGPDDSDQEVIVTPDRKFLLVANQGSDDISVFRIRPDGSLRLAGDPVNSGGRQPVSLGLARNDTLVVVNKGDEAPGQTGGSAPNYTSFHFTPAGKLQPTGSSIAAPPGSSPSQALISSDGRHVFGTNLFARPFPPPPGFPPFVPPLASEIVSLNVDARGRLSQAPGSPSGFPAPGFPPFVLGLGTHPTQHVLYGGFVVGNAIGVWTYDNDGALHFQDAVPLSGLGVCWITVSKDGSRLYASDATSDSIDVLSLADPIHPVELQNLDLAGPRLPLSPPVATIFNTTPFQLSLSSDDDFLYVLNHEATDDNSFPQGNAVHTLKVRPDGTLVEAQPTLVLPISVVPAGAHPLGIIAI